MTAMSFTSEYILVMALHYTCIYFNVPLPIHVYDVVYSLFIKLVAINRLMNECNHIQKQTSFSPCGQLLFRF